MLRGLIWLAALVVLALPARVDAQTNCLLYTSSQYQRMGGRAILGPLPCSACRATVAREMSGGRCEGVPDPPRPSPPSQPTSPSTSAPPPSMPGGAVHPPASGGPDEEEQRRARAAREQEEQRLERERRAQEERERFERDRREALDRLKGAPGKDGLDLKNDGPQPTTLKPIDATPAAKGSFTIDLTEQPAPSR